MEELLLFLVFLAVPIASVLPLLFGIWSFTKFNGLNRRVSELEDSLRLLQESGGDFREAPVAPTPASSAPSYLDAGESGELDIEEPEEPLPARWSLNGTRDDEPSDRQNRPVEETPEDERVEPEAVDAPVAAKTSPIITPERIVAVLAAGIGGLAVLVGAILGLKLAADNGFFNPVIRVSGAMMLGTTLWVAGGFTRGRLVGLPSALAGAGVGILYGSVFASFAVYEFLGSTSTLILLLAISIVSTIRAVAYRDRFMAYLGLFGSIYAPLAVSTGSDDATGFFLYLGLLSLPFLAIGTRLRWADLIATTSGVILLIFVAWTGESLSVEHQRLALTTALLFQVPLAWHAIRIQPKTDWEWITLSALGASMLGWCAAAMPWVAAVDTVFLDPRTYLEVAHGVGFTRVHGLLGIALIPLPLWVVARSRQRMVWSGLAVVVASLSTVIWSGSWTALGTTDLVLFSGPLLPFAVGTLALVGTRRLGLPLAAFPVVWLIANVALPPMGLDGLDLFLGGTGFLLLVVGSAQFTRTGNVLLTSSLSFATFLAVDQVSTMEPLWGLGMALTALAVLPPLALLQDWDDEIPSSTLLTGPLTPLFLAPAFTIGWTEAWGVGVIGLLPVLLGAHALLTTAVLIRNKGLSPVHPIALLGIALTLTGVTFALPLQLQSAWLTVGWSLEAVALAVLALRLKHPLVRGSAILLGVTVGARLLFNPWTLSYGTADGWPILNWTLYTWGLPTLCLVATAYLLPKSGKKPDHLAPWATPLLYAFAMGTGFALVNVQVSHAFQSGNELYLAGSTTFQGMVRSLGWGAYGFFLLLVGLGVGNRSTRFAGFAFLMLAASKVFVYDMWALPLLARIGSLFGLGFFLILAALLFNRLVVREPFQGDS